MFNKKFTALVSIKIIMRVSNVREVFSMKNIFPYKVVLFPAAWKVGS